MEHRLEAILRRRITMGDRGKPAGDHFPHRHEFHEIVAAFVGRERALQRRFRMVPRRDLADGDAGGSVDEQVWIRRREDRGLVRGLVEVRPVIDGVLVEVGHHRFSQRFQPRFRVPIGGGRVAVDRAEVPLAVDQGVAHVEVLGKADKRVVRGRVTVRVVVADDLADNLGALAIRTVGRQAHLPHRVEHTAIGRLQAVAHVGQRAANDYAHGVIHVRALHLVFDVDGKAQRQILIHGVWHLILDIEILDVERVVFDELAARFHLVAHQRREHQVGLGVILGPDLQ